MPKSVKVAQVRVATSRTRKFGAGCSRARRAALARAAPGVLSESAPPGGSGRERDPRSSRAGLGRAGPAEARAGVLAAQAQREPAPPHGRPARRGAAQFLQSTPAPSLPSWARRGTQRSGARCARAPPSPGVLRG